jgi:predicted N-acyltransferase
VLCPVLGREPTTFALRPGVAIDEALPRLDAALCGACRRTRRAALGAMLVDEDALPAWRAQGFLPSPSLDTFEMNAPASYDAYLAGLRKRDRGKLRNMQRSAAQAGVEFGRRTAFRHDRAELFDLLCEVYARHGRSRADIEATLSPEMFPALEAAFGEGAALFEARVGGRLAGYLIAVCDGETLVIVNFGLRDELARPNFVYFLLYDQAIRWAIEHGVGRLEAGATNDAIKRRLGFRPRRRWVCYRLATRRGASLMARAAPWVERYVLDRRPATPADDAGDADGVAT